MDAVRHHLWRHYLGEMDHWESGWMGFGQSKWTARGFNPIAEISSFESQSCPFFCGQVTGFFFLTPLASAWFVDA